MREAILAYHYADRLKAVFLIANSLLDSYEKSESREDMIHALFDALDGEVSTAAAVLGKASPESQWHLEDARHSLHQALYHFNTGEMGRSREQLARAISSVTTVAERSVRKLGL
jgi:septation ring formation regulator EzrA